MVTMPAFLRELIESEAYTNKQHPDYQVTNEKVEYYLRTLYPGEMKQDATGKFVAPEYDMTLEQFEEAQRKIDADFEEAKDEAEEEILDEYGEYFESLGISFDIDACVIPGESIPVKVLYYNETITLRHLETYDLDIPEFEKIRKTWVWHGEASETTCDECESLDGQVFYEEDDVPECPVHPNCRCWVEEIETDEDGNVISRSRFAGNPPANTDAPDTENNPNTQENDNTPEQNTNPDQIREESIRTTMAEEGGYIDDPNRIDQPTNSGITQPTLNTYNQRHPEAGFPENVRELTGQQAEQIYTEMYYNDRNIGNINDSRIAHAVFDMGVMSNYSNVGRTVQNTINETQGTNLSVDGDIGTRTIQAINNIPANQVDRFMEALKENRLEYLQSLGGWDRYGRGWEARTNRY